VELFVDGQTVRATTGGRPLDTSLPLLMFLHGASQDRTLWALQKRYFSHHGWSVLAPDLPGHGRSGGELLTSIESMAGWVEALLAAAGFKSTTIVGHSMGSLIALELAGSRPDIVDKLILTGTTAAMRVNEELQSAADDNERRAHEMIMDWSLASQSVLGGHPTPGLWMRGHLLRTSLNAGDEVLANDLRACHVYDMALDRASLVQCPTLILMGEHDHKMIRPQGTRALIAALPTVTARDIAGSGHALMVEQPDAVLDALIRFLKT